MLKEPLIINNLKSQISFKFNFTISLSNIITSKTNISNYI
nr:MAG TPA: hypothetical protein [Crassvirales sp.]